jgi:glutamate--cysteine ligase
MMNFFELFQQDNHLRDLFKVGRFGLEKENIRVDKMGHISLTPHPKAFHLRTQHPFITTDFAEAQIEMITPICQSIDEACDFIKLLHHLVSQELNQEYLWPYSQPPVLPKDLSTVLIAQFPERSARDYRQYLCEKYGKSRQLLSGVHFNFSFTPEFLENLHKSLPKQYPDFQEFCNQVYLKLARFYLKHAWLIVFLTGQGNVTHNSYQESLSPAPYQKKPIGADAQGIPGASSKRNGAEGYHNLCNIPVSYQNLREYIQDLKQAIKSQKIEGIREFYSCVRLKSPHGIHSLKHLAQDGIEYLEIRSLDLDPHEIEGVSSDTLKFLHLFLIFGLCSDHDLTESLSYQQALKNQFLAADNDSNQSITLQNDAETITLQDWGNTIFQEMLESFKILGFSKNDLSLIQKFQDKLNHPQKLPRVQLTKQIKEQGYQAYLVNLCQKYAKKSQKWTYQLFGYQDLELSTQILIREAIQQGIRFNFLDRQDNFLEFHGKTGTQWVKQATKTSLDDYITFLVMENKHVTKTLISRKHLVVPQGQNFQKPQNAKQAFALFDTQDIVIKPNNTNFGLGVSILKHPFNAQEFETAIDHAFNYDEQILIEAYFPGKEFRFLVINGQTIAVLHREPANVIGDGIHSIEELISLKNQDPRRGQGYKKPLEKIQIDDIVLTYLQKQKLCLKDIPEPDQKIYLRENSNVSTGGDSIDFTDTMPKIYKKLAVKATQAVNAKICGVDMIIKDYKNPKPKNNYCILELNFNPAIQMHTFPFIGQDRQVAKHLLKALKLK